MNPALFHLICVTVADVQIEVRLKRDEPNQHLSSELACRLDLIGALVHHGVIAETAEEISELVRLDFRDTAEKHRAIVEKRFGPSQTRRTMRRSEEDIAYVALKAIEQGLGSYRAHCVREGVDPDKLPKVAVPEFKL